MSSIEDRITKIENVFPSKDPLFEVENLCTPRDAGGHFIEQLSFCVKSEEIYGILDLSDARKTALYHSLAGLANRATGTVRLLGKNVYADPAGTSRLMGAVPAPGRDVNIPGDSVTPREALNFHAELLGVPPDKYQERITKTLELVRLSAYDHLHVAAFPGGMKRRLALARALLHDPVLLLIDEPTSGVDEQDRAGLWRCVRRMRDEEKKTLVLLTREWEEAQALCDRVLILGSHQSYQEVRP